ncbi:MAG: biopolymer transporter ExbD [Campylobacterota bacterium]|nr:biopolymer transporter ExbD [Campylobacterota bacterium]
MRKRRELLTPDITPLIDVVFILLIFFIVSSVFKKEELVLNLDLPGSSAKELKVEIKQLNIELSTNSIAYLGKIISLNDLDIKLSNVTKIDKPIIVRIDKDVKYERVVKILDILQKYSLTNLALVTQEE